MNSLPSNADMCHGCHASRPCPSSQAVREIVTCRQLPRDAPSYPGGSLSELPRSPLRAGLLCSLPAGADLPRPQIRGDSLRRVDVRSPDPTTPTPGCRSGPRFESFGDGCRPYAQGSRRIVLGGNLPLGAAAIPLPRSPGRPYTWCSPGHRRSLSSYQALSVMNGWTGLASGASRSRFPRRWLHSLCARRQLARSSGLPPRLTGTTSSTSGELGRPAGSDVSTASPHSQHTDSSRSTRRRSFFRLAPLALRGSDGIRITTPARHRRSSTRCPTTGCRSADAVTSRSRCPP